MDNRITDRRLAERRTEDRRRASRREDDDDSNVVGLSLIALFHGGFWLGAGLMIGRLLWGPV